MVAFIHVQEEQHTLLARLKRRLRYKPPEIRQVTVEGGLPFFVIEAVPCKGRLPWEEIAALIRANHLKLAVSASIVPPKEIQIPLFQMEEFPRVIGYRTFLYLLERFKAPAGKRRVGIIDLRGSLVNELAEMVDLAGEIMIITSRPYLYENLQEWAMCERGATVTVSGDIHRVENFRTLFLPNGLPFDIQGKGGIFSCKEMSSDTRRVITAQNIRLPEKYLTLMPDGYDPYLFGAVLYEQCNIKSLGNLIFEQFILQGEGISLYEALSALGGT